MKKHLRPISCLLGVIFIFVCVSVTSPAHGAVPKAAKRSVKKPDKTPPGFIYRPTVSPMVVTTPNDLPIMTFSANEDVRVEVEPWMGNGRQRLTDDILVVTNLKKGVKLAVPWTVSIISNGQFNFHLTMTDKAGNRAEYNAPFRVSFMDNQNRRVVR